MKIHLQTYLYLSSLGKYLKSLQVKYIRIYFDRNHNRPLAEKNFILAGDTLVRLKVQLVVEFFSSIICVWIAARYKKLAKTPERVHLKMSRPLPSPAELSLL